MIRTFVLIALATIMLCPLYARQDEAKVLLDSGKVLLEESQYEQAIVFFERAARAAYQKDTETYLDGLSGIMVSYISMDEYQTALSMADTTVAQVIDHYGEQHEITAKVIFNKGQAHRNLYQYDLAKRSFKRFIAIASEVHGEESEFVADGYHHLALSFDLYAKNDSIHLFFDKAIELKKKIFGENHPSTADSYFQKSDAYWNVSDFKQSLVYSNKVEAIARATEDSVLLMDVMFKIASTNVQRGNFEQTLKDFEEVLALSIKAYGEMHPFTATIYGNMGIIYFLNEEPDKGLEYNFRALNMYKEIYGKHPTIGLMYNGVGASLAAAERYEEAVIYFIRSYNYLLQFYPEDHVLVGKVMINLGSTYMSLEKYDSSDYYLNKARDVFDRGEETNILDIAQLNSLFGSWYSLQDRYEEAVPFFRSNAEILRDNNAPAKEVSDAMNNYAYNSFMAGDMVTARNIFTESLDLNKVLMEGQENFVNSFEATYACLGMLYVLQLEYIKGEVSDLTTSQYYKDIAERLIERERKATMTNQDRIFLSESAAEFFEGAIDITYKSDHLGEPGKIKEMFRLSEKNRSFLLRKNLNDRLAKDAGGVSQELKDIQLELNLERENQRSQLAEFHRDSPEFAAHWNRIFEINLSLDSIDELMKESYPKYFELRYKESEGKLEAIQSQLDPSQAILEYVQTDSAIYSIGITSNEVWLGYVEKDSTFDDAVDAYLQSFNIGGASGSTFNEQYLSFANASSLLYQKLLQPAVEKLGKDINHLIIVPSKKMSYAPWGALIEDDPSELDSKDFNSLSYLLRRFSISYAYSAELYMDAAEKSKFGGSVNGEVIAYAPSYSSEESEQFESLPEIFRREAGPLTWNIPEVTKINDLVGGQIATDSSATEKSFKESIGEHDIIHLAMHAFVDNKDPMRSRLLFYDDKDSIEDGTLHVYELLNMEIPAQMVVLSACETGLGKLRDGEGIMSLGRAFTYAGVPSVVTSFWSVEDQSTSVLMGYFYQFLAEGQSKPEALRQAKLKVLEESVGAKSHPYYWAGFGVLGNTDPVKSDNSYFFYLLLILIPILGGVMYRKRKQ